jgi:hypothetical protein
MLMLRTRLLQAQGWSVLVSVTQLRAALNRASDKKGAPCVLLLDLK